MRLTDVLPLERWRDLEDEIFARSSLQASVFDSAGIRITDAKRWANRLCPMIKADARGQTYICAVAHTNLAKTAQVTRQSVIGECDAGLCKLVVPIFYGDEFLGTAGGCGLRLDDGEVDSFMLSKTIAMPEAKASALAGGIASLSTDQMQAVVDFIRDWLAQHIPQAP